MSKSAPKHLNVKASHKEMQRLLRGLKNKTIKHIRFELKFMQNGVFTFDTPLMDMNNRPIKSISDRYAFYGAWTELQLEKLSIETLIEILQTIE